MNETPKILLVEDETTNQMLIKRMLNQQEYELIIASSGEEALELLESTPDIDVILLDIMMPGLNGFETLARVKANAHTNNIKVIMLSAINGVQDKVNAFSLGAADYITKPFDHEELIIRIEMQLQLAMMEKSLRASEKRFRNLFESSPDAIFVEDFDGNVLDVNPAACRLHRTSREELIGKNIADLVPPEKRETIIQDFSKIIKECPGHLESVSLAANGQSMPVEIRTNLMDYSGQPALLLQVRDITERKQMEQALLKEKALMDALMDNISDSIYFKDRQSRLTRVSRKMMQNLNLDGASQIIGKTDVDLFGEAFGLETIEQEQQIMATGEPVTDMVEQRLLENGQFNWTSTAKAPLRDTDGEIIGLVGITREINEQKRVEQAMRESEEKLRKMSAAANDSIIMLDNDGNISFWNEAAEKMFGYTATEALGRELHPLIAPKRFHHAFEQAFGQFKSVGQGAAVGNTVELMALRRDGTEFQVELSLSAVKLQGKWNAIGIVRDITERKQATEELRKLSRAVEQSASTIVITDANGVIEYVNPAFSKITGYTAEEVIGHNPRILKSGKHQQEFYKNLWDTIASGEVWEGELLNKKKNGQLYWEAATISPVKDEIGNITHFVAIKEDVTERKRTELELQQTKEAALEAQQAAEAATQTKSEFLANMSHEIRTPMNGVVGMTSVLLDTQLTAEQREFAEVIQTSGKELLIIINDILDFSKIEAGKLELEYQPFNLRSCVEDVLDLVAPKAAEKGLDLAYLIEEDVPQAFMGDTTRLRQILANLLSNAIKFTETGEVVVSAKGHMLQDDQYELHFGVRDTGIGIPEDKRNRLFQSFSQVDASTTRRYGGTGLGLAISKNLSELMDGSIWVESEVGQGSTFHFTIKAAVASTQTEQYQTVTQPYLTDKRLLIVDDNKTNRFILTRYTKKWGMLPTTVASGPEALKLMSQFPPFDLVILDMQMPDMDGLTLAKEIRKQFNPQDLPLIMLSSLGPIGRNMETIQFAASLMKPIKPSHLYDVLVGVVAGQPDKPKQVVTVPQLNEQMGQNHPLHILLAEDNLVNQKVMKSILERLGYKADIAANGLEVLGALSCQAYDVVLMDVQMPEMDGVEATRHIREQLPVAEQPRIIALTANALEGDREYFLEAGMDDYVSKPVQVDELIRALGECEPMTQPVNGNGTNKKLTATQTGNVLPQNGAAKPLPVAVVEPSGSAAIDLSVLKTFEDQMGADGSEVMVKFIGIFLQDAPKLLVELQQASAENDVDVLHRSAHSLKSNSAMFGAMQLSELCLNLEQQAKAGTIDNAEAMVTQIQQAFDLAQIELTRYTGALEMG